MMLGEAQFRVQLRGGEEEDAERRREQQVQLKEIMKIRTFDEI